MQIYRTDIAKREFRGLGELGKSPIKVVAKSLKLWLAQRSTIATAEIVNHEKNICEVYCSYKINKRRKAVDTHLWHEIYGDGGSNARSLLEVALRESS